MKEKFGMLIAIAMVVFSYACDNNDDTKKTVGETSEVYIDASNSNEWQYYSLKNKDLVGSGVESDSANLVWAARTDWDFAVSRYSIRTNSGDATSVNAQGGVYTCDASVGFESLVAIPTTAVFEVDEAVTSSGMSGTSTLVKSSATVIVFKTNEDGSKVMPPVYLQAPVYVFRTASGDGFYKVLFTQYQDETLGSGHVKFKVAAF
ncbi:MAG: HmuY family protein [Bacteroidales bacterium]